MLLGEYISKRLDAGEGNTLIQGLQNNVRCTLADALYTIPSHDWHAEISNRRKETEGQTLIWLAGRSQPDYSIQE